MGDAAAVAVGYYRVAAKSPTGSPIEYDGARTATDVREDGKWEIAMQTAVPKLQPSK